mmetsp:Transcript_97684/g.168418  ORF Transcript_97684/g.168418 Transcript_97684/m.168418 type:complete len:98 (+) Transcript_97684:92-385(+)
MASTQHAKVPAPVPNAKAPCGDATGEAAREKGLADDKGNWCTNGGDRHAWKRWHEFTPFKKYRCERKGCGFFKKCWMKCVDADTTCKGCHVIGHKRW